MAQFFLPKVFFAGSPFHVLYRIPLSSKYSKVSGNSFNRNPKSLCLLQSCIYSVNFVHKLIYASFTNSSTCLVGLVVALITYWLIISQISLIFSGSIQGLLCFTSSLSGSSNSAPVMTSSLIPPPLHPSTFLTLIDGTLSQFIDTESARLLGLFSPE